MCRQNILNSTAYEQATLPEAKNINELITLAITVYGINIHVQKTFNTVQHRNELLYQRLTIFTLCFTDHASHYNLCK